MLREDMCKSLVDRKSLRVSTKSGDAESPSRRQRFLTLRHEPTSLSHVSLAFGVSETGLPSFTITFLK